MTPQQPSDLDLAEILKRNPHIAMKRVNAYRSAITKKVGENYSVQHPFALPAVQRSRLQQDATETGNGLAQIHQALLVE